MAGCRPPAWSVPDMTIRLVGAEHIREVFGRMGFSDQEIVCVPLNPFVHILILIRLRPTRSALSGAHNLGRCHTDRSGFSGP